MSGLNLGCGYDIRKGYVNVDWCAGSGVNIGPSPTLIYHNLSQHPWPFMNNTFSKVLALDILEHLPNTISAMEEIWRVSAPGARVIISVPSWNTHYVWADPTHVRGFTAQSFDIFDPSQEACRRFGYQTKARFEILTITFQGVWFASSWPWRYTINGGQHSRLMRLIDIVPDIIHFLHFELGVLK